MKILVTGSSGMLGKEIMQVLSDRSEMYGCDITTGIDITQYEFFEYIKEIQPDIIIHCAAIIDVDFCEINKEQAYDINFRATADLARYCKAYRIKLIYISTHAVFDGTRGNYTERDIPNPINIYSSSKFFGECAIEKINPEHLILRVNIIGQGGLFHWIVNGLKNEPEVKLFDDIICSFVTCRELAEIIWTLRGETGLFHVGGHGISKTALGVFIAEELGIDPRKIKNTSYKQHPFVAKRPANITVNPEKFDKVYTLPSIYEMVRELCNENN